MDPVTIGLAGVVGAWALRESGLLKGKLPGKLMKAVKKAQAPTLEQVSAKYDNNHQASGPARSK